MDFVTAASSFHWLNTEDFRRECLRILKPGAFVYILFNDRDCDNDLSREQDEICRRYCPRYYSLAHGWGEAKQAFPAFFGKNAQYLDFDFPLPYTRETFITRSLSSSYSPAPQDEGFEAYRAALDDLFTRYASPDGTLVVPNYTRVCFGSPKE